MSEGGRDAGARFAIVLADAGGPGDSPAVVRLRMALKKLLRQYRLRCVSARQLPAEGEPPTEGRP